MDKQEITLEDLERLAAAMAHHMQDLDCPDCCDCGPVYQYLEASAEIYREEREWACLANVLVLMCHKGKAKQPPMG